MGLRARGETARSWGFPLLRTVIVQGFSVKRAAGTGELPGEVGVRGAVKEPKVDRPCRVAPTLNMRSLHDRPDGLPGTRPAEPL